MTDAGRPVTGTLARTPAFEEQARAALLDSLPRDPKWVAWVDGVLERLAGCVTDDPRLAQIRALCDEATHSTGMLSEQRLGADRLARQMLRVLDVAPVAATPPQGIDRDAVLDAIRECAPHNMELRPDGSEDPNAAAYVEGVHAAYEAVEALAARLEAAQ